ncbi:MAG TPA: c-type cytochrome [Thermoanaerobaculia bacterium]|nr:c-type cytochrome [Thermoanaerobaculia bacterium]
MRKLAIVAALLAAAPLFAQEQKNVQLLKGLTSLQLQRTMNMMRASLGTHCDYCHVFNEKDGRWDFANDEKPEKKRGREMIALTMDINQKSFGGRPVVSCYTCHRGSIKPVNLVALPQTAPPFPTPAVVKPQRPAPKDVIARYAAAVGDVAKLDDLALKGTREGWDGKQEPLEITKQGDHYHVKTGELEQDFGAAEGTVNGKPMNAGQLENMHQLTGAFAFVKPSDIPADARAIDATTLAAGNQRFTFDADGLLIRRVVLTDTPVGRIPQQTDYSDYREVAGVKLPHTIKVSLVDPWVGATRRYSVIEPLKR